MVAFICVVMTVLAVVGALTWADAAAAAARRRRLEQRVRDAEAEIDAIGRRTQAAILAAARHRSQRWRR